MEVLIKAIQLILSLSILVLVHEWGHYIAAKIFKTRVEKFYLFFDPWFSLFKIKRGDTEYGIGWLPLGGYVKIAGMIDESMDKEQLKQPAQSWEFRSKPAWQRLIIMLGGITMNVILGIFIYSMVLFAWGDHYIPNANLKYGIAADSTAMKIGFMGGDKILTVDNKTIERYTDVSSDIIFDGAKEVKVDRNGVIKTIPVGDKDIKSMVDAQSADFISPRIPFKIDSVIVDKPAAAAGLKKKDIIVGVDSIVTPFFDQASMYIHNHSKKTIALHVERDKNPLTINVKVSDDGLIGVMPYGPDSFLVVKNIPYKFFASFPAGLGRAKNTLKKYVQQFRLVFSSKIQGYKHIGGFISMAKVMPSTWDWEAFWLFTAFLSIALAFMNLLPIPALDGGHVMFTLYEMITKRKPNEKFLEYAQIAGMVILLSLMLFANGNDIVKHFTK